MNSKTYISIHRDVAMVVFVAAVFVLAVVYSVFSSTTIGDNVNTGGTLTVSGNSTVAQVSSSSNIYATSTLQATGNILGYANVGVGTTTPGTKLAVHGGSTLLGGETTIYGTLNIPYLQSTSTTASYFTGALGVGTTTPGAVLAHNGPFLAQSTSTINSAGLITQALFSTSTLNFYTNSSASPQLTVKEGGLVGIATSSPGAMLAVNGPGLFVGTSTIFGGLNVESLSATATLGFYTRGTAAPRLVIDSSGNLGVATSGPATTFSTVGSGYFTSGLGVGKATTGAGNLLVDELAVVEGRLGVNATTSPSKQLGVLGDVHVGPIGATASTTLTLESGGVRAGCIELRDSDGAWVSIYAGKGSATTTTATVISTGNQLGAGVGLTSVLVIQQGRCADTD